MKNVTPWGLESFMGEVEYLEKWLPNGAFCHTQATYPYLHKAAKMWRIDCILTLPAKIWIVTRHQRLPQSSQEVQRVHAMLRLQGTV